MTRRTIHPFPARMAPEVAGESLAALHPDARVLDPMCGSGTVLREAVERGLSATGCDIDPLSVLMSRVWTTPLEPYRLLHDARQLVQIARDLTEGGIDNRQASETQEFIDYWFAEKQQSELRRLSSALSLVHWATGDALALALSRTIVTKEMAASLARDTSHSRPHRVATTNDYDVFAGFVDAARLIAGRLDARKLIGQARVTVNDARALGEISDGTVDMVVTSPPYLNAIDYLRGHRMSLVWMGYKVESLRGTRRSSIGAERRPDEPVDYDIDRFTRVPSNAPFSDTHRGWIRRYAHDMNQVLAELFRVTKPGGQVVLVVGNSFLRGASIDNAGLIQDLAINNGIHLIERRTRRIPARRRYLPPPGKGQGSLDARMRTEVVMSFGVP